MLCCLISALYKTALSARPYPVQLESGYVASLAEPLSPNLGHAVFSHLEPDLRCVSLSMLGNCQPGDLTRSQQHSEIFALSWSQLRAFYLQPLGARSEV
eukprot:scaffold61694_cov19-Tisochrysis_lutea.AAC.1